MTLVRAARWAVAPMLLACAASPVGAVVTQDCALPASTCTLAQTARQAHVHVGATAARDQSPAVRALLATHFTAVTAENAMKWGVVAPLVGVYDVADADEIAGFAAANGLRLRGHTLLWGRLQLPADLDAQVGAAADPAARLRELVRAHVETMTRRYGGRVALWDVVNEPFDALTGDLDGNLFFRTLGPGWIAEAFTLARALDPDAELVVNEFSLSYPSPKLDALAQTVSMLRAAGVPIDGIGLQAHFFPFFPLPSRQAFEEALRALGSLGIPLELTELDVSLWHFRADPDPLARQAAFYADVVGACMAVPACRAVTLWGVHDGESWLDHFPPFDQAAPNAPLLFDTALQPKPAYAAVRDAVRTRATPFFAQARALRGALVDARKARAVTGAPARVSAKRLGRAGRYLRRGRFAVGCAQLGLADAALAGSVGPAAAALRARLASLRADLACDDPS